MIRSVTLISLFSVIFQVLNFYKRQYIPSGIFSFVPHPVVMHSMTISVGLFSYIKTYIKKGNLI